MTLRRIVSMGVLIYGDIADSSQMYTGTETLKLIQMRATEERDAIKAGWRLKTHLQIIADQLVAQAE